MPTVVIIGGGFSGTAIAVHLLRQGMGRPGGRVVLVNRSGAMARGVAYGTQSDHHVLNVPAGGMSAFEDDPDSFVRFLRQRGVTADEGSFVCRHHYGTYLEALLRDAAEQETGVALERVAAEVLRIEPAADGTHAWVSLDSGARIRADRVVLAVGNYPPIDPPIATDNGFFRASRRYVPDPWRPGALAAAAADPEAPVLLIGTGLTMVDIVLELRAVGVKGRCVAVSRRGLMPVAHRALAHAPGRKEVPPNLLDGPATVRAYLRSVRRHVRAAAVRDVDWRDIIASLRPLTPRLWQALSVDERRRFLRHLKPFWETHRHRVAPQLHDDFLALQRAGDVIVRPGRLLDLREAADRVVVRLQPRGARETVELEVGTVINCTGPASDTRRLRDPLFEGLQSQGLLRPDHLGLGVETASSGALIGADERASATLYYVGPFLRARDWEATAVPELRRYARQLAGHLIETLDAPRTSSTS
jgi:uncharacterized NAD(P)/FAD-binding protein YdhS